jgi:lipoprotein-anchoring transpeptidase ErfK/SrfK
MNRRRHPSKTSLFSLLLACCSLSSLAFSGPSLANPSPSANEAKTLQSRTAIANLMPDLTLALKNAEIPPIGAADTYLPDDFGVRLVVSLKSRRVSVYKGDEVIASYPIAIGKAGWETPVGTFQVYEKEVNPIFKSFKSGRIVQPGPDNPLGVRWIGIWTDGKTRLGFHGTNEDWLIGQAVSHGCIRMHNKDVVALFNQVKVGTPVIVKP